MPHIPYVDAHCHLDHPLLVPNLPEIIERAKNVGVIAVISNGIDPESNRAVLDIAKRFPECKPALGLYPDNAYKLSEKEIVDELEFIKSKKEVIIAIGEVGLDFVERRYEEEQKKLFEKIMVLSKTINKPLIIHSRKAESEIIEILQNNKCKKVILHCFCGRKSLIQKAVDAGYFFTIPTSIVRATHFQEMVKIVPLSQLLVETDAPFLSPIKEVPNEPSFVIESVKMIAEGKGMTVEETANSLFQNYQRMFL